MQLYVSTPEERLERKQHTSKRNWILNSVSFKTIWYSDKLLVHYAFPSLNYLKEHDVILNYAYLYSPFGIGNADWT